jgi:transcriptional regulator with XRE-family HTH domain
LAVVAGLAGISKSYLSMLELGQRALDRRSVIVALANALEIAPSELTALPVPAPGNGDNDSAVSAVRQALIAVHWDMPGGQVLPVEVLRARVHDLMATERACEVKAAGTALPALIRDVNTSVAAGRDVAELLDLTVLLHSHGSASWLYIVNAPVDLRSLATLAARQAAERREDPVILGLAARGSAMQQMAAGDFVMARTTLDSVTVPTTSADQTQLAGKLALARAWVASAEQRPADVEAAMGEAAELAGRTGEGNAYWLGFGPTNVGLWNMAAALESGDHPRAVAVADGLDPRMQPNRSHQAAYWIDYGRALARIRGRRDDAVLALRRAEKLDPVRVVRDPFVREVLGELLPHAKPNAVGRELRGIAYRAGMPV